MTEADRKDRKNSAGKGSPWRFAFLAAAVYAAWNLFPGIYVNLLYLYVGVMDSLTPQESWSIGVIGGADGPTAVLVAQPVWVPYALYTVLLVAGIAGYLMLRPRKSGKQ